MNSFTWNASQRIVAHGFLPSMESWFKFSATAPKSNSPRTQSALQPGNRQQVASQLSCTAVLGFGAAAAALLTAPGTLCFGLRIRTDGVLDFCRCTADRLYVGKYSLAIWQR